MSPARKTVLYEQHLLRTDRSRLIEFAGYLMPVWYSSIPREHQAVRQAAGLFDCTHMGVWSIRGATAADFLEGLTTQTIASLAPGKARYGYIVDTVGAVLDDVIVYRLGPQEFMMVVNAVNHDKIGRWFARAQEILDERLSGAAAPEICDLADPAQGRRRRVDLALQGPASREILERILPDDAARNALGKLKSFEGFPTRLEGSDVFIAATGYTGSSVGYELYVHPDQAGPIWQRLLQAGEDLGLVPCGLGARDSLRIEAGLPLYGHELAGAHRISPFQAGYGWAVKLDKPFFIGQEALRAQSTDYTQQVQRLELPGRPGVRPVRPDDAVLADSGECVGWVLSCARVGESQIALALVDARLECQETVGVYYLARSERHRQEGRKESVRLGETMAPDVNGTILERMARF
ncbi:MAG: hypothetical protein JW810_03375 [Sedimentisphaerales bacterium]|nr:hypothetical protein [Sedimentisphaerales bacterium]